MSSPIIALFLPSLEGGGAERVFVQLANAFVAFGCRVDIVLATARGPFLEEVSKDVRIVDLRGRGVLSALPKLVRYIRSRRPEAVLSGLDHANMVAILARCFSGIRMRCIVSIRSVPTAAYRFDKSARGWVTLQLAKVAYRFADAIIANSQFAALDVTDSLRIPAEKSQVIYNPIDSQQIRELSFAAAEHPWLVASAPPMILGVGSLTVLKDFSTLIRAFDIVRAKRACLLVILGEGSERQKLESLIHHLGLGSWVQLPGFVANPFVWMRHAKVVVSSSLTEGCPNVLMQALACDTSVVSTDCPGGSAEILESGKWGELVPVGNSIAMAEAIVSSLDRAVRNNLQDRVNDFLIDRIARQYLELLLPGYLPDSARH